MIFYLHYILLTSGLSGISVLLGVFLKFYTDASQGEIGVLLMSFPFASIIIKPLFCSLADRYRAHQYYLISALILMMIGYAPFIIIPYLPNFYQNYPRISWYSLALSCHVGNGSLGVAWSLGDSLAVNMAQKTHVPYSRMRLMGTISWGLYGFIIGQINEVPHFPKFVPSFIILEVSVLIEIILLILWNKEDFLMCDIDEIQSQEQTHKELPTGLQQQITLEIDTTNQLNKKLEVIQVKSNSDEPIIVKDSNLNIQQLPKSIDCEQNKGVKVNEKSNKNHQILIFKMILIEDGRLIKYLILFTMFGFLLAPMNFVFLSFEDVCKEKGCNFSQLAGAVLMSQAAIETLCFLVLPYIITRISRSTALTFGLLILAMRFFFYAGYYYTSDISPYWALVGEWGHGISYGIFCTILADIALMFANQSRLFIPEMRKLGFISDNSNNTCDQKAIEDEENSIKMALRATMQAIFGGFMDGLGQGLGSLACGIVAEAYGYIKLWQIFAIIATVTGLMQQIIELTKSRWSDSYKPRKGSKTYEIFTADNKKLKQQVDKPSKVLDSKYASHQQALEC